MKTLGLKKFSKAKSFLGALSHKGGGGGGRKTKPCGENETSFDSCDAPASSSPSPPRGRHPEPRYCAIHPDVLLSSPTAEDEHYCSVTGACGGCYKCRAQQIRLMKLAAAKLQQRAEALDDSEKEMLRKKGLDESEKEITRKNGRAAGGAGKATAPAARKGSRGGEGASDPRAARGRDVGGARRGRAAPRPRPPSVTDYRRKGSGGGEGREAHSEPPHQRKYPSRSQSKSGRERMPSATRDDGKRAPHTASRGSSQQRQERYQRKTSRSSQSRERVDTIFPVKKSTGSPPEPSRGRKESDGVSNDVPKPSFPPHGPDRASLKNKSGEMRGSKGSFGGVKSTERRGSKGEDGVSKDVKQYQRKRSSASRSRERFPLDASDRVPLKSNEKSLKINPLHGNMALNGSYRSGGSKESSDSDNSIEWRGSKGDEGVSNDVKQYQQKSCKSREGRGNKGDGRVSNDVSGPPCPLDTSDTSGRVTLKSNFGSIKSEPPVGGGKIRERRASSFNCGRRHPPQLQQPKVSSGSGKSREGATSREEDGEAPRGSSLDPCEEIRQRQQLLRRKMSGSSLSGERRSTKEDDGVSIRPLFPLDASDQVTSNQSRERRNSKGDDGVSDDIAGALFSLDALDRVTSSQSRGRRNSKGDGGVSIAPLFPLDTSDRVTPKSSSQSFRSHRPQSEPPKQAPRGCSSFHFGRGRQEQPRSGDGKSKSREPSRRGKSKGSLPQFVGDDPGERGRQRWKRHYFSLGQSARASDVDAPLNAQDLLLKIARLKKGDGAWVKRSGGDVWTYAILGREDSLIFIVNEQGATKEFSASSCTKFVRIVLQGHAAEEDATFCPSPGGAEPVPVPDRRAAMYTLATEGGTPPTVVLFGGRPADGADLASVPDHDVSMHTLFDQPAGIPPDRDPSVHSVHTLGENEDNGKDAPSPKVDSNAPPLESISELEHDVSMNTLSEGAEAEAGASPPMSVVNPSDVRGKVEQKRALQQLPEPLLPAPTSISGSPEEEGSAPLDGTEKKQDAKEPTAENSSIGHLSKARDGTKKKKTLKELLEGKSPARRPSDSPSLAWSTTSSESSSEETADTPPGEPKCSVPYSPAASSLDYSVSMHTLNSTSTRNHNASVRTLSSISTAAPSGGDAASAALDDPVALVLEYASRPDVPEDPALADLRGVRRTCAARTCASRRHAQSLLPASLACIAERSEAGAAAPAAGAGKKSPKAVESCLYGGHDVPVEAKKTRKKSTASATDDIGSVKKERIIRRLARSLSLPPMAPFTPMPASEHSEDGAGALPDGTKKKCHELPAADDSVCQSSKPVPPTPPTSVSEDTSTHDNESGLSRSAPTIERSRGPPRPLHSNISPKRSAEEEAASDAILDGHQVAGDDADEDVDAHADGLDDSGSTRYSKGDRTAFRQMFKTIRGASLERQGHRTPSGPGARAADRDDEVGTKAERRVSWAGGLAWTGELEPQFEEGEEEGDA